MNKRFHLLVGALVASILPGCHCTQVAEICQSNTDCAGGRVCVNGQCCLNGQRGFPARCGVGGREGGRGGDGACAAPHRDRFSSPDGAPTPITGTVSDPSGQVPIYNALVYVPNAPVAPFTQGVSCNRCDAPASGSPLVAAL